MPQGTNGTFKMFIADDEGIFEVTPSRGINEATFLVRVKNSSKLDFEERAGRYIRCFAYITDLRDLNSTILCYNLY